MNRHDPLCPVGNQAFDLIFVNVQRVFANVAKNDFRPATGECGSRRDKRKRRTYDFVARSDARQHGGHFQRGRA